MTTMTPDEVRRKLKQDYPWIADDKIEDAVRPLLGKGNITVGDAFLRSAQQPKQGASVVGPPEAGIACRPSPDRDPAGKGRTRRSVPTKSEAAVQREVVRYLKALGYRVWRVGQRNAKGTQDPGVSDLIVIGHSKCLFIEVKSATGKQRPEQRAFEAAVRGVGNGKIVTEETTVTFYCSCTQYHVVRSLADVDRVLGVSNCDTNIDHA